MDNIVSCRVCFADRVKLHMVINSPLKELYEYLANVKCGLDDEQLTVLCYLCYARLLRCYSFQRAARKAETLLTDFYNEGTAANTQSAVKCDYVTTPVQCDYISDPLDMEHTWIHDDTECERDDDVNSTVEETQTELMLSQIDRLDGNGESSDDEAGQAYNSNDTIKPQTSGAWKLVSSPPEQDLHRKRKKESFRHVGSQTDMTTDNANQDNNDVSISMGDNEIDDYGSDEDDNNGPEERLQQELIDLNALNQDQEKILDKIDRSNDRVLTESTTSEFLWEYDDTTFFVSREQYKEKAGPTFDTNEFESPLECFLKMVEPEFVDLLVERTNKFANESVKQLEKSRLVSEHSRLKNWQDTDRQEMYRFLGLLICQGLYHNPTEKGYWYGLGNMDVFKNCCTSRRFLLLKKWLYFAEPDAPKERLYHVKPVIDYFSERFSKLYQPDQEVVFEEMLLKRKGRELARKISQKAQLTAKTFELCDAKTGYIWKFFIHANTLDKEAPDKRPSVSIKILLELAEDMFNKGHTLVLDNFYNSPLLARYLKSRGVDCFGTVRLSRQFISNKLKKLTKTNMAPGDLVSGHAEDVCVQVWRDNSVLAMLSTYHAPGDKEGKKPTIVLDYNAAIRGVDRKDQALNSQPIERCRNLVWYKKIFRRLLNIAIFNSYVIYQSKDPKMHHRVYREIVVAGLMVRFKPVGLTSEISTSLAITRGRRSYTRTLLTHQHFPVRTGMKMTRCVWCAYRKGGGEARSVYKCKECDACLCINKCFIEYHTVPD